MTKEEFVAFIRTNTNPDEVIIAGSSGVSYTFHQVANEIEADSPEGQVFWAMYQLGHPDSFVEGVE